MIKIYYTRNIHFIQLLYYNSIIDYSAIINWIIRKTR